MQGLLLTLATTLALIIATPVWSAGGGGGSSGGGSEGSSARASAAFNPDPDYQAAMAAVKAEDWTQVVARMGPYAERNPGNADAFNELAHAYRRLGDMDKAFKNYEIALRIDPKHKGAHEYLGEAYLQIGDLARAEKELQALDSICFFPCEQYTDLKKEIELYKSKGGQAKAGS
ncbi:MAG TPA: tetratricopeptide repeat protein [Rhizobacter sp.]|jgi:tetratricopeptide (TPR) repeat protein|nr:tetratricopeptide repeat protein [Rhizobacter sp.]